ncbi:MAG: PIN domain-containing protein [Xanthobacteraceae bacterium]|nr:PIN domain-containing protein [Xanthobacteraceae bacterium]
MSARPFLDTNIIVYAFSVNDPRSRKAEALVEVGGVISVQVLNEFVHVLRRKQKRDWPEIADALDVLRILVDTPAPITAELHEAAVKIARRQNFSIYDSLIVAAAQNTGCEVLYSEDFQHGQRVDQLTIRNPFVE